jgi:hypothetical protein
MQRDDWVNFHTIGSFTQSIGSLLRPLRFPVRAFFCHSSDVKDKIYLYQRRENSISR